MWCEMASYAPLLAHVDAWQWKPDAIWFDNLRSFGTTDYYVQKVFASNIGTRIVPVTPQAVDGLYTSATLDENAHELIVKAINYSPNARSADIRLNGIHPSGTVRVTTLASSDLDAENNFDHPMAVAPVSSTLQVKSASIPVQLPPTPSPSIAFRLSSRQRLSLLTRSIKWLVIRRWMGDSMYGA